VIATCRNPGGATALNAKASQNPAVFIEELDVSRHETVDTVATKLNGKPINILVNNAGIASDDFPRQMLGDFDFES
jgi:NAD(P)-dependent dehydrogenase (short-subunit alcohol dehydrogenase family)